MKGGESVDQGRQLSWQSEISMPPGRPTALAHLVMSMANQPHATMPCAKSGPGGGHMAPMLRFSVAGKHRHSHATSTAGSVQVTAA
jgi:hypothetical protein